MNASLVRARHAHGLDAYPSFSLVVSRHILCHDKRASARRRAQAVTRPAHTSRPILGRMRREADWAMETVDYRNEDEGAFERAVISRQREQQSRLSHSFESQKARAEHGTEATPNDSRLSICEGRTQRGSTTGSWEPKSPGHANVIFMKDSFRSAKSESKVWFDSRRRLDTTMASNAL